MFTDINTDLTLTHYGYPSIEQFRNVIYNVNNKSTYVGQDENNEPVYDQAKKKPVLTFLGTTKMHGTNASVVMDFKHGRVYFQSRENVISPVQDNAGFATSMASFQSEFVKMVESNIDRDNHDIIVVYGEWCGCFYYDTPITLADGTKKKIGEIVRDKLDVEVLCYNKENNKLEKRKVINWFNNGETFDWLTITFKKRKKGGKSTRLIVTPNHKIFSKVNNQIQEISAGNLKIGDIVFTNGETIPYMIQQFIKGTILGDASFVNEGGIKLSHSNVNQPFYNEFIKELLNNISTYKIHESNGFTDNKTSSFYIKSLPLIKDIREEIFIDGLKQITKEYLNNLHPPALAAWYMDDGSLIQNKNGNRQYQCELATQGFSKESNKIIVDWLNEHGYECYSILHDFEKQQYYIRFTVDGAKAFLSTISPYVIEGFNYKLPEKLQNIAKFNWAISLNEYEEALIETKVEKIELGNPYDNEKYKRIKYDIEIEGQHNYFANNILVHNSNIQNGVALNGLNKMFVVFDVALLMDGSKEKKWVSYDVVKNVKMHDKNVFNILDFPCWSIDIDFAFPQLSQNRLVEITTEVENSCPVGKAFGKEGTGEGVVWKSTTPGYDGNSGFWMKIKGEKHAGKSKVKTLNNVDDEKIKKIIDLADKITPEWRLEQMLEKTVDFMNGGQLRREHIGSFIRLVINDIMKEELDLIVACGVEPKKINGHISKICQNYFFEKEKNL